MEIILQNLLSPIILFFILGIVASLFKSDLSFPSGLSEALSIYLLIAIGIKGGIELSNYSFQTVITPLAGTLFLGILTPVLTLVILKVFFKMDLHNAIGLAATYGSVSIVTYGAAIAFLGDFGVSYESFMSAMVVVMEIPAILVALILFGMAQSKKKQQEMPVQGVGIVAQSPIPLIDKSILRESFFGKSVLLLLGSLLVGLVTGEDAIPVVQPLFMDMYYSVLILFLLNMGLIAGKRLSVIKEHGIKLISLGVVIPVVYGVLGIVTGYVVGLSQGGATLMGVLAASASYIAAPAALRASVPKANPSIYLGLALGITFPFNLIVGIPLMYAISQWFY
ncbi:sodium-dependent bicarbonate transport family permease [Bacillus sp. FJAT-44742]|uniref:sodium-dependent bicarbonate transport family permease n=1 Tax=Bacillus sp. FJAT-44742 TaxID=2014005 RepID=UPI000C237632|nr:sodium-dependent bicarbonate transport family permease [Bacillus sp. FJAT-44742]